MRQSVLANSYCPKRPRYSAPPGGKLNGWVTPAGTYRNRMPRSDIRSLTGNSINTRNHIWASSLIPLRCIETPGVTVVITDTERYGSSMSNMHQEQIGPSRIHRWSCTSYGIH